MPTFEWHVEWGDILGALGALILLGGAACVFVKWINPIAKKANRISEFILGRPKDELGPAIPSLSERFIETNEKISALDVANTARLDEQNEQIAEIKAQVTPNHGSSAHDKITSRIDTVESKVDAVLAHLGLGPIA